MQRRANCSFAPTGALHFGDTIHQGLAPLATIFRPCRGSVHSDDHPPGAPYQPFARPRFGLIPNLVGRYEEMPGGYPALFANDFSRWSPVNNIVPRAGFSRASQSVGSAAADRGTLPKKKN